jgi:hypothetical protein
MRQSKSRLEVGLVFEGWKIIEIFPPVLGSNRRIKVQKDFIMKDLWNTNKIFSVSSQEHDLHLNFESESNLIPFVKLDEQTDSEKSYHNSSYFYSKFYNEVFKWVKVNKEKVGWTTNLNSFLKKKFSKEKKLKLNANDKIFLPKSNFEFSKPNISVSKSDPIDEEIESLEKIEKIISSYSVKKHNILRSSTFPFIDVFLLSTNSGEEIEKILSNEIFNDLTRVINENHDHKTKVTEKTVETKSIRMIVKGNSSYEDRAISILDDKKGFLSKKKKYGGKISTITFQQIKPKEFQFLLCVLLFKDGMDLFILPSSMISSKVKDNPHGKAYISGQHKGNFEEGQLNYNDKILSEHYLWSIYNNGEKTYFFDRKTKKIGEEYIKQSIEKIINEKFSI